MDSDESSDVAVDGLRRMGRFLLFPNIVPNWLGTVRCISGGSESASLAPNGQGRRLPSQCGVSIGASVLWHHTA